MEQYKLKIKFQVLEYNWPKVTYMNFFRRLFILKPQKIVKRSKNNIS